MDLIAPTVVVLAAKEIGPVGKELAHMPSGCGFNSRCRCEDLFGG